MGLDEDHAVSAHVLKECQVGVDDIHIVAAGFEHGLHWRPDILQGPRDVERISQDGPVVGRQLVRKAGARLGD